MAARGGGAKLGGALPKLRSFGPKPAIFRPKQPYSGFKIAKRRQTAATLHVRLDFLVTKGPLVPSNSTICPRNGPKERQKAPKTAQCAPAPRNQERAVSWATWLKKEFRGHLVHPQPPTFYGFQRGPTRHVNPRTSGYLVQLEGRLAHAQWGPTVGPPGAPGRKKRFFPELFLDHLGCSNKWF